MLKITYLRATNRRKKFNSTPFNKCPLKINLNF
jgi:hypothetical protein